MSEKLYQVGGSLRADAPSYVVRQADRALYEGLRSSEFCYVLNSRQMGKSSLRVRVMQQLRSEGCACVSIDITLIKEQQVTARQWYGSLMRSLANDLELGQLNLRQWWQERDGLPAIQCFSEFIDQVLLPTVPHSIVIFIDEIDSILGLEFKDDFFALIRAFYNRRSDHAAYRRLTFCLLGVTTPSELIQDRTRTPFNIGQAIDLRGFQLEEAQPLEQGFSAIAADPHTVLKEILNWTSGQPFLTQKLCQLVTQHCAYIPTGKEAQIVAQIVQQYIIENWETQDDPEHLRTIRDRLLYLGEQRAGRLLGTCQQIVRQGSIPADGSSEQIELRLTGLIVRHHNRLKIYNQIYQTVFHIHWLTQELAKLRPYGAELEAWLASEMLDESRLLRGRTLRHAMRWSQGKSLSDEDYRFLGMSQELEKRELQEQLHAEAKAKKLLISAQEKIKTELAIANERLVQVQQQTEATIQQGRRAKALALIVAGATVAIAIGLGIFILRSAQQEVHTARQVAKLVQDSSTMLRQFERGTLTDIDAILSAMTTAKNWQTLKVTQSPTGSSFTPIFALQQVLQRYDRPYAEMNRFVHSGLGCASFVPTRSTLTTVSKNGSIYSWSLNGQRLNLIKAEQKNVIAVSCNADGTKVALSFRNGTLEIWNTQGKLLRSYMQKSHRALTISFSPDNQTIVTGSIKGIISIWNLNSNKKQTLKAHKDYIYNIEFSRDGKRFVTASEDKTAKLWNLNGQQLNEFKKQGVFATAVHFSLDGTKLAIAWNDGTVQLRSLTGIVLQNFKVTPAWIHIVRFSPDSRSLMVGLNDGIAQIWSLDGKLIQSLKARSSDVIAANFYPSGKRLIVVSNDGVAYLWSSSASFKREANQELRGHNDWVRSVRFSPDDQILATASSDTTARLWTLDGHFIRALKGHKKEVSSLDFSPDGSLLATASRDGTVRLWSLNSQLFQVVQVGVSVLCVRFSPDGASFAIALKNGNVQLRSRQGQVLREWQAHQKEVFNLNFNRSGTQLVTASYDKTARIWSLDGQLIQTFPEHRDLVLSASFSPDDQTLATASADNTARLWSLDGQLIREFVGSFDAVRDVQFSPDGSQIAIASDDGTVRLLSLDGQQLQAFNDHRGRIYGLQFSRDGSKLASASGDTTAHWWKIENLDGLLTQGCQRLHDYLIHSLDASDRDRALCALSPHQ